MHTHDRSGVLDGPALIEYQVMQLRLLIGIKLYIVAVVRGALLGAPLTNLVILLLLDVKDLLGVVRLTLQFRF